MSRGDQGLTEAQKPSQAALERAASDQAALEAAASETAEIGPALGSFVRERVLPRLRLANGLSARPTALDSLYGRAARHGSAAPPRTAATFAEYALACDAELIERQLRRMLDEGWTVEEIYLDLFEPTARRLGWLWERDLCGFTDVAIGVGRLAAASRRLSASQSRWESERPDGRRALFAPAPGETHTFGLGIVAELCRRRGWRVSYLPSASADDLAARVRDEHFDVVGFSLSDSVRAEPLKALIGRLRGAARAARPQDPFGVMVGGGAFARSPELVLKVGADATAKDAGDTPARLDDLLDLLRAGR